MSGSRAKAVRWAVAVLGTAWTLAVWSAWFLHELSHELLSALGAGFASVAAWRVLAMVGVCARCGRGLTVGARACAACRKALALRRELDKRIDEDAVREMESRAGGNSSRSTACHEGPE